ncbi:MAG: hypothetical protein IJN99_03540 [Clostridia bacterium]|nr:hypothetical protein [Clostridia bacterium]
MEMSVLNDILKQRGVPSLLSKEEMMDIMFREEYGYMPPKPEKVSWEKEKIFGNFCAGKATLDKVNITSEFGGKKFTFPVYVAMPTAEGKFPFFVHIAFRDDVPDRYMPTEELIDNGFAVLTFCYKDVTSDDGDFTDGLAGVLYEDGKRSETDAGKIAMWAWASHRVMDYAESVDCLDKSVSVVCGQSRLGKTALLAGATDERFVFTHSNDSGCSGAAITKGKGGEHVIHVYGYNPFWYCKNYAKYVHNEDLMQFDQHYLVASIAPRYVSIASAETDEGSCPESEMLTCVAASPMWERFGKEGFVCDDRLPMVNDVYHKGSIGYILRKGTHYFGREDWQRLIEFINLHKADTPVSK